MSGQITLPLNRTIYGGDITLDFSSVVNNTNFPDNTCVYAAGRNWISLPALSASPTAGADTLTFSSAPSGLVPGSIIAIRDPTDGSFNAARTYYRAGEYCEVRGVSGTTVTLKSGLLYGYDHTVVTMHQFSDDSINLNVSRLTIKAPNTVGYGVILKRLRDTTHDRLTINGGQFASMARYECVNISGREMHINQDFLSGQGVDYGLVDGSGCDMRAEGYFSGRYDGYESGNGFGLTLPCRYLDISGVFRCYDRTNPDRVACGAHGNVEFYRFSGSFFGGVSPGGNHGVIRGLIDVRGYDRKAMAMSEMLGFDLDCDGVHLLAEGNRVDLLTRALIDGGRNNNVFTSMTKYGGVLKFTNMVIDAPDNPHVLNIRNAGFVHPAGESTVISLAGTTLKRAGSPTIRISVATGDVFSLLDITDFKNLSASSYVVTAGVSKVKGYAETGTVSVTSATGASFVDQLVTFSKPAPRPPRVVATLSGAPNINTERVMVGIGSESITTFTARLMTVSGNNFPVADARNINWMAIIDE